jgi:hypothetical protein
MAIGVGQLPTTPPLPGTTAVGYINVIFTLVLLNFILNYPATSLDKVLDGPL